MSDFPRPPSDSPREEFIRLLRVLSLPFAACLLFFLVTPSGVQPLRRSTAEVRRLVVGVVESQFMAFRDGDYARAYSFAASGIQQQLTVAASQETKDGRLLPQEELAKRAVAAFERMVKDGYPIIAYWRTVSFGEVADNGREAVLLVSVQGRGGRTRFFRYLLVREAGEWRINGVVEVNVSPAAQGQMA